MLINCLLQQVKDTFPSPALDQTQEGRRQTLARGEIRPCCCLPQLWPAVPSTAAYWGLGQMGYDSRWCLDSWCRERELEKGETGISIRHSRIAVVHINNFVCDETSLLHEVLFSAFSLLCSCNSCWAYILTERQSSSICCFIHYIKLEHQTYRALSFPFT